MIERDCLNKISRLRPRLSCPAYVVLSSTWPLTDTAKNFWQKCREFDLQVRRQVGFTNPRGANLLVHSNFVQVAADSASICTFICMPCATCSSSSSSSKVGGQSCENCLRYEMRWHGECRRSLHAFCNRFQKHFRPLPYLEIINLACMHEFSCILNQPTESWPSPGSRIYRSDRAIHGQE